MWCCKAGIAFRILRLERNSLIIMTTLFLNLIIREEIDLFNIDDKSKSLILNEELFCKIINFIR